MRAQTKDIQQNLTPERAIEILREGNRRFVNNLRINRNLLQQVNETSDGQYPFAAILSCIDSRTSAELIFDQGLGDIFSIRIAGNVVNDDILGSMEFATKVAGSKLIVVLGHTGCGAVKGACQDVKMGHLSDLLKKIRPAVHLTPTRTEGERNASNPDFVDSVAFTNVLTTMKEILNRSQIIRDMINEGEIGLVGGMYNIETGNVEFFGESSVEKELEVLKDQDQNA